MRSIGQGRKETVREERKKTKERIEENKIRFWGENGKE